MGGEVDIILQPFFQVCSVGFWREKQSNFGSGVLNALANIDLLSGAGLFYHTSIWKGSKYGRFSAFSPSTNVCGIGFHLGWWRVRSLLLFISFCEQAGTLRSVWAASNWHFPPFLSPWWYTFICNLVSCLASVRISFICLFFCLVDASAGTCVCQYCSILRTCLFWWKHFS